MTKPTKWPVRPSKTPISLGICPVWSESSPCAQWVAKVDARFLHVNSEDSDQTGRMPRLIWVFVGRTCHFVGLVMRRLNYGWKLQWRDDDSINYHNSCEKIELINYKLHMSPVKRICVFEHSVMTNFNCACPAIQRGQGSGFLSEGSSWLTACMSEQRRFWRDCADAQARLNLRCSHRR